MSGMPTQKKRTLIHPLIELLIIETKVVRMRNSARTAENFTLRKQQTDVLSSPPPHRVTAVPIVIVYDPSSSSPLRRSRDRRSLKRAFQANKTNERTNERTNGAIPE